MNETKILSEILVIDDFENVKIINEMLSGRGFMLSDADSFASAISHVKSHQFDLILLRCGLQTFDGFDLCKQLKSTIQTQDIPLILLIPASQKHEIGVGIQKGADDYLIYPFNDDELLIRVDLHLHLKKIREDLIRSRENAEATAKTKAMFLANISHEIRTPMNGIIGMTDILKQTELNNEQQEYLEIIRLSGENLLMLINDVLDFSKIEAGQITIERIKFNLYEVINEVIKILRYKADKKNLEFGSVLSPDVPEVVFGDPLRLKQILINLCTNAIKFTNLGFVKIKVSVRFVKNSTIRLLFEVQDSGIGISVENQAKLFQSFAQAEASTTRKYGGTGLGLAISKNLVELMNGKIGVDSQLGKGSNFFFETEFGRLSESETEMGAADFGDSGKGRRLKILLAEDNVINQKVAILNLEKLGHEVIWVSDGKEALEKFISEVPDLIFMDIQMSGMDGVESTRKIREWEKMHKVVKKVPIVAMTAHTLQSDKELFFASGMDDILYKPFNWNDLVGVLDRMITLIEDKNKNYKIWNSAK